MGGAAIGRPGMSAVHRFLLHRSGGDGGSDAGPRRSSAPSRRNAAGGESVFQHPRPRHGDCQQFRVDRFKRAVCRGPPLRGRRGSCRQASVRRLEPMGAITRRRTDTSVPAATLRAGRCAGTWARAAWRDHGSRGDGPGGSGRRRVGLPASGRAGRRNVIMCIIGTCGRSRQARALVHSCSPLRAAVLARGGLLRRRVHSEPPTDRWKPFDRGDARERDCAAVGGWTVPSSLDSSLWATGRGCPTALSREASRARCGGWTRPLAGGR